MEERKMSMYTSPKKRTITIDAWKSKFRNTDDLISEKGACSQNLRSIHHRGVFENVTSFQ